MSKRVTTADFIFNAKKIHGDKYDYSLAKYFFAHKKVDIICSNHGLFKQEPNSHLKGKGCPHCGFKLRCDKITCGVTEFIAKANKIHNNKYDYSKMNYCNGYGKIEIICPKHGSFLQVAKEHARGHGCSICNESKGERYVKNYLTIAKIKFIQQKKFTDCKHIYELPFDFYLPDLNMCIEYHGEQHFKSIPYWGGIKGLILRQKRDSIKEEYCKSNKITLVKINFNDDIDIILNKIFITTTHVN